MNDVALYKKFQRSPIFFIETVWGLKPERDRAKFVKGKHVTWQQHDILLAVESALRGEAPKRISVKSGHGIGKSTVLSWLVLWFLFCFKDAQIPCTAPTSDQMYDVLWKEIANWHSRMPKEIKDLFEIQSNYVRVRERPETWFARAKTARKEAPEALAGVHGDHVMMLADEAPGIPEEIFNTAEGALTGKDILVILISNGTRLIGYFYDTHHRDKKNWQTLAFSSIDSPIVEPDFVARIIEKHGIDSDEYRVRVLGEFPAEDAMDDKGYVPLLVATDLKFVDPIPDLAPYEEFTGTLRLGVDPSGEGDDETVWVVRDNFKARVAARERVSNSKSIAQKTLTIMDYYNIDAANVWIDNFGEGANVAKEIALSEQRYSVNAVNVGAKADEEAYLNKRAEAYYRLKQWVRTGGELFTDKGWQELLNIRYRSELSGRMKIMGKLEMRKEGIPSPNVADALMLTFVEDEKLQRETKIWKPTYTKR